MTEHRHHMDEQPVRGAGSDPATPANAHAAHETPSEPHAHSGHDMPVPGVQAHGAAHGRHAGHSVAMFRDKFGLSLLLTLPIVIWSADVQEWLGYTAPTFPGSAPASSRS